MLYLCLTGRKSKVPQGSFSQQVSAQQSQQQQGRVTRSQRKQQAEQQRIAEYNFNMWQQEAERLRSEVFVDKQVEEKYTETVPKKYVDRYGNIMPSWYRLSDRGRELELRSARDQVVVFNRSKTVTDPFTFEEYSQEYQKLDPNIKQFFASPESITAEQERKKQVERDTLQKEIDNANQRLQNAIAKLQKERDWFNSLEGDRRKRNRESFERSEREYEYDIEEYQDQIREAQGQAGKIEQGATANDIWNYAEDKADYDRRRHESKDSAREKFNQAVKTGSMDEELKKVLKLNDWQLASQKAGGGITFDKFNAGVEKYNQDVAYNNQILAWRDKVGFDKLPDYAKAIVNKSAMDWQKSNPTEKLVFDKQGNVVGVESGKLQKSMSLDAYNQFAVENTPEKLYAKWEEQQKNKPLDLDIKIVNTGLLPYQTRGTINTQATGQQIIVGGQAGSGGKPQSFGSFLANTMPVTSQVFSGLKWIDERVHYDPKLNINPITKMPQIDLFSFGLKKEQTQMENTWDKGSGKLSEYALKVDEWTIGKENIDEFKKDTEAKYQGLYQNAFERKYMKDLIYGNIDYETASAEFENSAEAKRISERYNEEFGEGYNKLKTDVDFSILSKSGWKGIAGGVAKVGLGVGSMGLTVTKTPLRTAGTVATIWAGGSALKLLGTKGSLALTGGFLYSGLKTTFDKTKPYDERAGGLVTAVVTGASLSYAGYKYLNSPVIKTAKIPKPKADLYASETIGKDLKVMANGKTFNKVLYGEQKLSQVAQAGRRTIVTTKWRSLMNKYLGTDFKAIYEGIPSNQRAIYGSDVFRGGSYKITQSGYEKAFKKLTDYGWTKSQARTTLRYYAPKVTEQWLKSGSINIKSDLSASGKFIYETRKPILDLGGGIKTRGGRTIQEVYNVERKIIQIKDQQFMLEMRNNVGKYLNKKGVGIKVKDVGFSTSVNKAWSSDQLQGVEFLRKQGAIDIYRDPAFYKDIYSVSRGGFSITLTPKRTKTIIEIMDQRRSFNVGKTKLFEWELDFDKAMSSGKNIIIQKGNKGAFGSDQVSKNVEKVVEKITGQSGVKMDLSPKSDMTSVISDQKVMQLSEQLKGGLDIAPVKQTKMANIPRVKSDQLAGLDVGLASVSAVKLKQNLKMNNAVKLQLNEIQQLKVNQINSQLLKQQLKQQTTQTNPPLLRFQTPTLNLELLLPRLNVPTWKVPPVKPFPKIFLFGDEELKAKVKAKAKRRSPDAFALLPDFTSRAIGLAPQEFGSVKDAMKEINRMQTGFEVRRGGRVKGISPIDEKSLLRGIMK